MSVNGNFGIRRLIDSQMRWMKAGQPAYLRVKNFNDSNQDFAEMGFLFTPSATGAVQPVGYVDLWITPQPLNKLVSMHNLGQAAQAGIALRQGARQISISHSWVKAQANASGLTNPKDVFESPSVVGIVTSSLIVSIESVVPDTTYGQYVIWHLMGNVSDLSPGVQPIVAASGQLALAPGAYGLLGNGTNTVPLPGAISSATYAVVSWNGLTLGPDEFSITGASLKFTQSIPGPTDKILLVVIRY